VAVYKSAEDPIVTLLYNKVGTFMRTLVLTRGIMASSKSTWIAENGLAPFTLSSDNLRLLHSAPQLQEDGKQVIAGSQEGKIWKLLFEVLERRMQNGDFTVIDATHITSSSISEYRELANKYRYRVFVVDFTNVPLEIALERNKNREEYKYVPEHKIEIAYAKLSENHVPSYAKVIKPEEFWDHVSYTKIDYSSYRKIHHIGDVHGCYSALMTYLSGEMKEDELYIFVGDYLDRGIQNREVLEFLIQIKDLPNVILLEGNHETHLRKWSMDETVKSLAFNHYTEKEIHDVNKSAVRELCRKFRQVCYYEYYGKTVLVTHGGLSCIPNELALISTSQFIKGVGNYEVDIDAIFSASEQDGTYQVHGHRNIFRLPMQAAERSFNLEGRVESGGDLRALTLTPEGFQEHCIQNHVFTTEHSPMPPVVGSKTTTDNFIEYLQSHKMVKETQITDHISSFNFTRKAFNDGVWDTLNIKARGLFVNKHTRKIVSRSYDKFFNIDEVPATKMGTLANTLEFPVILSEKPNGYLGIIGYDEETDELIYSSKSETRGTYAVSFRKLFEEKVPVEIRAWLKGYLYGNDVSITFEVILPQEDPHIIEYKENTLILLDIIQRNVQFQKRSYSEVVELAMNLLLPYRKIKYVFHNWLSFYHWYQNASQDYSVKEEGYVLEDNSGFMTKIKLPYYLFWKQMRTAKFQVKMEGYMLPQWLPPIPDDLKNFVGWAKQQDQEYLKRVDVIQLRTDYEGS
jgi:predicted kinase/UDP-2,3-diacylglucosamine pyrophosphatase LpxH